MISELLAYALGRSHGRSEANQHEYPEEFDMERYLLMRLAVLIVIVCIAVLLISTVF
jgi:hypothetical protein